MVPFQTAPSWGYIGLVRFRWRGLENEKPELFIRGFVGFICVPRPILVVPRSRPSAILFSAAKLAAQWCFWPTSSLYDLAEWSLTRWEQLWCCSWTLMQQDEHRLNQQGEIIPCSMCLPCGSVTSRWKVSRSGIGSQPPSWRCLWSGDIYSLWKRRSHCWRISRQDFKDRAIQEYNVHDISVDMFRSRNFDITR